MAKATRAFYCKECGNETSKWEGRCPACGLWNTLVEAPAAGRSKCGKTASVHLGNAAAPVSLSQVDTTAEDRIFTGISELDRVLGGGIVKGSLVLVGGDPGIGKSTLLLQMCRELAEKKHNVLYISGEESLRQIKLRADRIGKFDDTLKLFAETDTELISGYLIENKPEVCVIDSIQTMCSPELDAAAGSVSQVREVTQLLLRVSKENNIAIFIVGHVTKEGTVAGPRMLEHMVDTVLYFEGGNSSPFRMLRAVKNRFGSTNELGVFEMQSSGLREVVNPSEHLLYGMPEGEAGSVITSVMEGTRPMLAEVQALVSSTGFNMPRRTAAGTDGNRVNLLIAVMEKHMGVGLSNYDAYINVAGGIRIVDPSLDLALIAALYSGYTNIPLPEKTVIFGEVGLTGEVRAVSNAARRVIEADKLGYKHVIMPKSSSNELKELPEKPGIDLILIDNVKELKGRLKG